MTPDAREQARHKASVMIAFAEGKEIQFKGRNEDERKWMTVPDPTWRFHEFDYRVKPEERKPREWTVWINEKEDIVTSNPLLMIFRKGKFTQARVVEVPPSENTGGQDD